MFGRVAAEKPSISKENAKARLKFAKDHINWTTNDWKRVLWSDETPVNKICSDRGRYVRRPKNKRYDRKYIKPTVKFGGGKVMIWGCFSYIGVGPLVRIEKNDRSKRGGMDAIQYRDDVLSKAMLPYASENLVKNWVSYLKVFKSFSIFF